ncbi:MAG: trypsin-like peptidase domain-containing protein [Rhizobiales bacterium]|nr:trypsin-like peptidase domain-containing protein [Hyphomicrobiales bacterium]
MGTAAGALAVAGALAFLPAYSQAETTSTPPITTDQRAVSSPSFADMVEKVRPAVVSVKVTIAQASMNDDEDAMPGMRDLPPGLERFFRQFGDQQQQQGRGRQMRPGQVRMGQGSGFFISSDGEIVTNNHVVQGATDVEIVTDDGRTLAAKVVGTDPRTDLALLKVKEKGVYPYVQLATTPPRVGDWVVAVGNPFGLGGTVTAGIVSARGRDIGSGPYDDYLQIDAPVNKGNSGGPSFTLDGKVAGVNTAIYSPSGGSVGIGFAIPARTVETVVAALRSGKPVERGFIGVSSQPVSSDVANAMGLPDTKGALVAAVNEDSPGAKAGLKKGDLIVAVNGDKVADPRDLARKIGEMKPGEKATLQILHRGKEETVSLELGKRPAEQAPQRG